MPPLPAWKMASIASWQPRPGRKPYDLGSNRASHSGSSALAATACRALSAITGIPSGRRLLVLPRLGIYTRLTGRAIHGSARCCTHSARSALACGVSATSPSMPAVMRPALTSVTRRTLTSAFDRDRSISFCRLRTRLRSPACDAVKIRCRKRRTFSSAARQSTSCHPQDSSSGPFTTAAAVACNLSFGSSAFVIVCLTGSPDPRQRPFGPGHQPGIRPVIRDGQRRGQPYESRFPAAFRPPAFASRVILFPPGSWAFLAVGLPGIRPDPDGVSTFRTCEIRPGWVPSLPRGRRCSPGQMPCPASACRFSPASPCTPHLHPTSGAPFYEASTRVHAIHPSGLPLTCDPPDGTDGPWAFPCAPHPAVTSGARQGGARREHAPRTTRPTSSALQSTSSLARCDLVSQRQKRMFAARRCSRSDPF